MKKFLLLLCVLGLCILSQAQQEKLRVAILDPTTSGIAIDEGTKLAVQELISSTFVNTGQYIIIERSMIDKIIKEQSFQNSDMADNTQATEIGKLAGANKVVLSAVSLVGGRNMLSIKMIDVKTASIDQQKTKIVSSNDLLDAVEPLTKELLGEKALYVKQNNVFSQEDNDQQDVSKTEKAKENDPKSISPKSNVDYKKFNADICKQISSGISAINSTPNPKLAALISEGKLQSKVSLSRGVNAEINENGVLHITGSGEMVAIDEKILSPFKSHAIAVIIEDGVTKIDALGSFSNVQYVSLPSTTQAIEDECFNSCSKLMLINIPEKVSKIGKNAFKKCKSISTLVLPNSIEHIGTGAFNGCENLSTINIPEQVTIIPEACFSNCRNLREIIIPAKVTTIGRDAFMSCRSIQSIFIPDNVISIGEAVFQHMRNLYEIRLSENIPLIPAKAFDDCGSLVKIICPASVKSVGEKAFSDCGQLIQITFLSEHMSSLGSGCFDDCNSLGNIVLYSLKPPTADKIFGRDKDCFSRITISVPTAAYAMYKKADFWEDFDAIATF